MAEDELRRLRELVRSGDTQAFWRYWKEMERRGEWRWRWRVGTLPDLVEVQRAIMTYVRSYDHWIAYVESLHPDERPETEGVTFIHLEYRPGSDSWSIVQTEGTHTSEPDTITSRDFDLYSMARDQVGPYPAVVAARMILDIKNGMRERR